MSERELQRVQVLTEVVHGRRSAVSAAHVLALSLRHTRRLRIILQPNNVSGRLEGKHVDIFAFADGRSRRPLSRRE
ncbi:hypothetical protein [Marinivivus vitaminiproducens]|uniref:hypothetical protein n=1 Tax=Marinivivus vitaminiproducens TaxID=3035935 RepID=UPI00279CE748|nr:hypothetical protein P4R82_06285 [Geminicoccaceae bacterium SCSIO 64248]